MAWKELSPENLAAPLPELLAGLDCLGAARLAALYLAGRRVWLAPHARDQIGRQFAGVNEESGGLLLGKTFQVGPGTSGNYDFLTFITEAVAGRERQSSAVSLHLDTSVWAEIQTFLGQGLQVVGWYHSHPRLGAFFSTQDRHTQSAFFPQAFMVGLVIDPFRNERKCFAGPSAIDRTDQLSDSEEGWLASIPVIAGLHSTSKS